MTMTIDSIEDLEAQPEARANKPAPTPEPFRHKEAPQIRAAIDVAKESNLTADTVNRAIATGRSLGLPMRVVANSLGLAQREELARRIESNPMLADWVGKDEYRAAVAAGDTEKIVNLFDGLQTEYQHRQAQRNDLTGVQKFGLLLEEGVQDVANSLEAGITGAVRALGKTGFTDDDGNRSAPFAEATATWADVMDSQRDANIFAQPPRLEAATTLGGYLQDVVRTIPQLGSQIAATLATGGAGGLAFMGNQIAGSTYDKLRRDGVDTNRAFIAGLGNAVLQAPLERLGLGRIMKIFKATGAKTILKRTAQGAATEGLTEFLQAYPESATEIWAKLGENEGAKEWFERFKAALPETARQGLYEGLVAAPTGILGGVGRALHETAWHNYVRDFQQRQIEFHDRVDDLRGCGMDTEIIQGMLEHGGMGTELGVSAQGLVELYQTGRDLITPLGLNVEDVLTAAETGQDVTMSLSRMHASLDKEAFAALAPHIRPSLYGPTAVEAAENPVNMADVQRVAELYQDNRNLFAELDAEKARLKEELRKEIANSPNMQVQVEGFGGFDKFADDWLSLVERYAMRMGTSQNPIETMRRITLDEIRARASGAQPHGAEPAVAPEIAATKRIAPETRNEETEVQEPAREADDFSEWLAAQESLVNPFEDAETQQTAQPETAPMPENAPAAETADINGNLFYNIFRDEENKSSSQLETRQQSRGHEELSQDGIPSGENNNQDSDNVNLDILESSDKTSAKRGSVQIYPESYLISLFEKADLSTLLHETGHIFFEEMERLVRAGAADASVMADYQVMRDWLGAREGEPLAIEQREQVARGFEAYLMEGRAPAPELQSAFRRFKKWLLRIYQSAVGLRVELNDDVRAVFSRMISTEQEIMRAASENELLELTAKEISELGLTDNEAAQINAASANAREQSAEALQNARDANRIERRAKYAREAAAELAENQTYIARRDLRKTPLDIDAIRDGFGENLAAALRKKLPATTKKDGADPEIFAAEHGYKSADEMFTDILNSQTKGNAIREIVDRKEAESDAKFSAMEALLDTQDISTQMDLVGRKLADLVGAQQIERQAYTIAAQQELARMPVGKAMQTSRYMAAMRRNILGYRHALFAGDREKALDYNRKALLNYEFAVQAQRLAKTAEKLQDRARDFVKSKTAGADARYFVADIAARHGLMRENEKLERGRNQGTIVDWVNSLKAEGVDLFLDDEIALGQGKYWRGMTVTEFDNLVDTLTQIITAERNQRKLLTARNKADLDAAADEIAASIFAHNDQHAIRTIQTPPKVVEACKRLHAIHTKVEALCLAVDGDKMGPTWEYIYRPINEAENNQNMRLGKVRDELKKIFSAYTGRELGRMGSRKEFEPAIGEKISYENRLCVALNMGNRDNINRLHEGHNWTDNQIAAIVAPLTAKDWNFVQQVWDYLDTFKKESFDLQQDVTGIRPKAVEAQPFQVTSSDGVVMDMKGGYYPIRYNPRKGEKAFQQNQQQMDQQLFGGRNYGSAQTRQGHLQQRSAGGLGTPLLLELSVTTDHVFNTVHDLAYRRAVLDVAKVIRHPTVVDAFERTVGRELYHQLKPWLQDVANEQQAPMGSVEGWARWARTSSSIMQMGYKVTTMLAQPMGITQTMELIGYKWTVIGLKEVYKNPMRLPDFVKETFARSSFMAGRLQSFDRDVRDITKSLNRGGYFSWVQTLRDKAFLPMGFMQMGVDLPSWWGAYSKGLQDFGGDETKAAEYADSIVRQAQGSGSTKDLARVQRGSELARLFTLFYSYFNTFYNLGARSIRALRQDHSPAGIYRAANSALLLWFLPCILTELVAGRGPGDDEDKAKWAASLLIQYPFQAVVGLRDLASGIFGKYDYQLTAAQSAPKSFVTWANSIQKAVEKDDYSKLAKPTAEAVGYAFGLPLKQPIITVGNMWNWMIGEDPDFAVRDLFLVKQKK